MIYVFGGLCFLAIVGVGLALTASGGGAASKRAKAIGRGEQKTVKSRGGDSDVQKRNRQTRQMLEQLRQEGKQRKSSLVPRDTASLISQAGLDLPTSAFWIISAVSAVAAVVVVFLSGAGVSGASVRGVFIPGPLIMIAASIAGFFGLPRWILGTLAKMRAKKMTNQFADAIDVIVRGVKSGLPLTECLRIIARESPAPLGEEFETLTDNIAMGTSVDRSLQKFYERVPLPEVNFFVIVLTIQSKSGGNLSEALGNLSNIIRSRKMMREKIKAMSSEAKASAMIIASLPFVVGVMVYMTTPEYIAELWLTSTGHMILAGAAGLMFTGIMVMRRMINFEI